METLRGRLVETVKPARPACASLSSLEASPLLTRPHCEPQIPDDAVEVVGGPKKDWLSPVADALQTTLELIKEALEARGVQYAAGWSIICLVAITKVITYPLTRTQVYSDENES
jgi:hypothetical protein